MVFIKYNRENKWVKSFLIFYLSFLLPLATVAQQLTGRAPSQVAVGEQFRLTYTINTQDVKGFRAGNVPEEFDVLMGPSTSTQSSFQMVNGHTSSTSSVTYTYILVANKQGTFTIPAAHAIVDGKTVHSGELRIKVAGQIQGGGQGQQQRGGLQELRPAGSAISGSDLFIKVSASKHHVREQEPILLTYKVYTLVGLTELRGKMADLKSFYSREVPLPQEKTFKVETLNGRQYRTVTWQQYVVFPQTTGKLEIPSITYEGTVVQQNRTIDPFEAFFNGGSGYVEVKKQIKAPGITIQVDPLPQRPADFSGGVGYYTITAKLERNEVKANDPIKLRVVVSGSGNMKLLKQPVVKFPKDFDSYDAKVTDKTKLTVNGIEGSMVYDFLAVPRHQGKYEIPAIEYVYFDTQKGKYNTIKTEPFTLNVAKGDGNSSSTVYTVQEDIKQLADDIRYIHIGDSEQLAAGDFFFGSSAYWTTIALLLVTFVSLFIIFRRRAIEHANVVKQRAGKANKVAVKRLKEADKLMRAGHESDFYDEVLRALWGYVGDRLNMPVEQLSRENVSQQLENHGVSAEVIQQFIGALEECEYARFAPGDAKGNMKKVYDAALSAITQIASTMKKKSHKSRPVAVLLVLLFPVAVSAVTKSQADSLYAAEHYQQAAQQYEILLKQGSSADLYYNLGNAYYRMDNITQAIIAYERALLLDPGDKDIRMNLQLARTKTIDKIMPESEFIFLTWYLSIVSLFSIDNWAYMGVFSLLLVILLALVYLFADLVWLRKIGFFGGIMFLFVFLLCNLFAWQQKQTIDERTGAVVIPSAVNVKSTPAKNGTDLFILHEGTKVTVVDASMKEWCEIRVADGKQGWVESKQLEII